MVGAEDSDEEDYREQLNRSALSDSAQKGDLDEDSEHDDYRSGCAPPSRML